MFLKGRDKGYKQSLLIPVYFISFLNEQNMVDLDVNFFIALQVTFTVCNVRCVGLQSKSSLSQFSAGLEIILNL